MSDPKLADPSLLGEYALADSRLYPQSFTFTGSDGDWIVRLYADGRVERNEGVTLDEAAIAFWDAVERMGLRRG